MSFFLMSVHGAVMIIVVVIARALAVNRLPKKTFLVLWGMVLVRLLVPYSIPSVLSVYSLAEKVKQSWEAAEEISPAMAFAITQVQDRTEALDPGQVEAISFFLEPQTVVWLIGAMACTVFFAVSYIQCRREFLESLPVENDTAREWLNAHPLRRPLSIRYSDRISTPLTFGVLRPVILMPKSIDWKDSRCVDYVLAHEYVHIRRLDAVTKLILTAAVCMHWFNPAVWVMYILANRDMELSCDETVVRLFGENTKTEYAMTLIRMEEARSSFAPFCNSFGKHAIEERIVAIMKIKKYTFPVLGLTVLLITCILAVFATSAQVEAGPDDAFGSSLSGEEDDMNQAMDVEWWTEEEYKAWLEQEKVELASVIGDRGWTPSTGWFTWTQEMVDETIRQEEEILREIQAGNKVSKTIYGEDGDAIGMISYGPSEIVSVEDEDISIADGFEFSGAGNVYLNGSLVHCFSDVAPNGRAFTFTSAEEDCISVQVSYDGKGTRIDIEVANQ